MDNATQMEDTPLTPEEIEAIRKRHEAATPGPWVIGHDIDCLTMESPDQQFSMGSTAYYPWVPQRDEDWEFISHAREDIPRLLAALAKARGEA